MLLEVRPCHLNWFSFGELKHHSTRSDAFDYGLAASLATDDRPNFKPTPFHSFTTVMGGSSNLWM